MGTDEEPGKNRGSREARGGRWPVEGGKIQVDYLLQTGDQEEEREATDVKLQQEVCGDFCTRRVRNRGGSSKNGRSILREGGTQDTN